MSNTHHQKSHNTKHSGRHSTHNHDNKRERSREREFHHYSTNTHSNSHKNTSKHYNRTEVVRRTGATPLIFRGTEGAIIEQKIMTKEKEENKVRLQTGLRQDVDRKSVE